MTNQSNRVTSEDNKMMNRARDDGNNLNRIILVNLGEEPARNLATKKGREQLMSVVWFKYHCTSRLQTCHRLNNGRLHHFPSQDRRLSTDAPKVETAVAQ